MFESVAIVIGILIVLAIVKACWAPANHGLQTYNRREEIKKLKREGHDWKQITLTLEKMGFQNKKGEELTEEDIRKEFAELTAEEEWEKGAEERRKKRLAEKERRLAEKEEREREKRLQEEERKRKRKLQEEMETQARRALIAQLYADSVDIKEITFILRRAGYNSPTGGPITMKEIMEEHADMQIEKHKKQQAGNAENVTRQG